MSGTTSTPKTKAERQALFAQLFAGTTPAEPPTTFLADQIRIYREEILAYHAKGYSWTQIQEKLKQPPLNIDASIATITKTVSKPKPKKSDRLPVIALPPRSAPAASSPAASGSTTGTTAKK